MAEESIRLEEYRDSEPIRLSEKERQALHGLVAGVSITPEAGREGWFRVNPGNQVGAIQIGTRRFELKPKLSIDRLLFLVSYSMNPRHWRERGFGFKEREDLFEAVVPGFAYQLERAMRHGQLFGYHREEEALQTVRGRIRFDDQIRNRFGLMPPIECRFDEFTQDIELNRQLKAAITRLERIRIRDGRTRKRLLTLKSAFNNVSSVSYSPNSIPEIHFDRLNDHYRAPAEFARLILGSRSIDTRSGLIQGDAFLLDMSRVFEDFVVKSMREQLGLSEHAFPQQGKGQPLYLDKSSDLRLKPDLSWWEGDACVFIGDVKYKKTRESGHVLHPDVYQLLAYTTATDLPSGTLVYAKGESTERNYKIRFAGKEIKVRTLDLTEPPDQILKQIRALVDQVRETQSGHCATKLLPA